ncbi:uncharacterized protein DC041_0006738 [Schistosoma bovis]|uniref:Serine-threonine/tyrosine-protein kinase catalytic domain-containing protein n=1 Tax=Schistosoma bovis TaxID=6184 RepID=A0A430Q994_SCHBO|nr:uncharacterized protein DC041_0006738 [Schistosoma bovis]
MNKLNIVMGSAAKNETIIFEINTRCYPYEELDLCHCIKYLLDGQRDDGRAYCIPSSMKILMFKCWSNDPSKRPSMNKITQELIENPIHETDNDN